MDFDDEDLPRKAKPKPKDLGCLGIEELKSYIAELEHEIARAKETIRAKQKHGAGAEGLFRK
ncbi:MAG: DUF1192 domain-containing protein [Pseudomonadota bacterium]